VVDARVVPVGVDPDGQVDLPDSGAVLGWYQFGSRPGSPAGSAVVVGHRDTVAEGPGALFDLPDLQPGDRLEVRLADGSSVAYRVVARESLVKQRLPLDRLFARDGQPRLTVITCGGAYLPDVGGYQENVVVTAVPTREGGR
jgi:sortase (surface protein transpeptidase)